MIDDYPFELSYKMRSWIYDHIRYANDFNEDADYLSFEAIDALIQMYRKGYTVHQFCERSSNWTNPGHDGGRCIACGKPYESWELVRDAG